MESYIVLGAAAALLMLLFFKARHDAAADDRKLEKSLRESFGRLADREYERDEYDLISHYYRNRGIGEGEDVIDDITWNDLDMDNLFMSMNMTLSQTGDEYLYDLLRRPAAGPEGEECLRERSRVIRFFSGHEEERLLFQKAFASMGRTHQYSLSDYIRLLDDVKEEKNHWHYFCILLGLAAISMIFLKPPLGFGLILFATALNIATYFRRKGEIAPFVVCFIFIVRAMRESGVLLKKEIPELKLYQDRLRAALSRLRSLNHNTWLLMSGRRLTGSILELLMHYLRIFFQLALIRFNEMLDLVKREKESVHEIFRVTGFLDSMIAVSSFREALPAFAEPVFVRKSSSEDSGGTLIFEAEGLYHPLLKNPVSASISASRGVLVTGSNASGKSTFLKSAATAILLSETIATAPASSLRLTPFAIYSSMSLRDDILAGESYYMVEIRAMNRILDAARRDSRPLACFVDEVLRGTNTVERIAASSQLLKSLSGGNVLCFAATHDIELTHMLENEYDNYHFSETIREGKITFSYELLPGRADSRDAIRLLDMIGYDKSITEAAFASSEKFLETGIWERV